MWTCETIKEDDSEENICAEQHRYVESYLIDLF
jgi:hypothetical protein